MTKVSQSLRLRAFGRLCLYLACIATAVAGGWRVDPAPAQTTNPLASNPNFFDPDGYYFPREDLVVARHKIEWIELRTLEYYYDGASHYDNPRFIPPSASLRLTRLTDQAHSSYDCPRPVISRDTLSIVCPSTPIGAVSIRGAFVDKRGQFLEPPAGDGHRYRNCYDHARTEGIPFPKGVLQVLGGRLNGAPILATAPTLAVQRIGGGRCSPEAGRMRSAALFGTLLAGIALAQDSGVESFYRRFVVLLASGRYQEAETFLSPNGLSYGDITIEKAVAQDIRSVSAQTGTAADTAGRRGRAPKSLATISCVEQAGSMPFWDVSETVELLGRFGIFWSFVFSRRFRSFIINEWRKETVLGRVFGLLEGAVNALIGLSAFIGAGLFVWWVW